MKNKNQKNHNKARRLRLSRQTIKRLDPAMLQRLRGGWEETESDDEFIRSYLWPSRCEYCAMP